jgi:MFS family permease
MAFTQGFLVRRLMPRLGERKMLVLGMLLMGSSFFMISSSYTIEFLALAMLFLAIGNGFVRPSLLGIVSILSKNSEQGKVMGQSQSAASMGRILGPILGGWLYTNHGMGSPFVAAGVVTMLGFAAVLFRYTQLPDQRSES